MRVIEINECACLSKNCHSRRFFRYHSNLGFESINFVGCVSAIRHDYIFKEAEKYSTPKNDIYYWFASGQDDFKRFAYSFIHDKLKKHIKDHEANLDWFNNRRNGRATLKNLVYYDLVIEAPEIYEFYSLKDLILISNSNQNSFIQYSAKQAIKDIVNNFLAKNPDKAKLSKYKKIKHLAKKASETNKHEAELYYNDFVLELLKTHLR